MLPYSSQGSVLVYAGKNTSLTAMSQALGPKGLALVGVDKQEDLLKAIRTIEPRLILLHWDSKPDSLRVATFLKSSLLRHVAPLAVICENTAERSLVMQAMASGADDLIGNVLDPAHFALRVQLLLGWSLRASDAGLKVSAAT